MMGHPNCLPVSIPISVLSSFSADDRVYRSFNRLIAASPGTVLMVPMRLVHGSLAEVVDGCPVPWEELHDILESEAGAVHVFDFGTESYSRRVLRLAEFAWSGWSLDFININRNPNASAWRFTHDSGICFACAADLVYEE